MSAPRPPADLAANGKPAESVWDFPRPPRLDRVAWRVRVVLGGIEVVDAPYGGYRIRMLDGAGDLMVLSVTFPTKSAAVAGIAQDRELACT